MILWFFLQRNVLNMILLFFFYSVTICNITLLLLWNEYYNVQCARPFVLLAKHNNLLSFSPNKINSSTKFPRKRILRLCYATNEYFIPVFILQRYGKSRSIKTCVISIDHFTVL